MSSSSRAIAIWKAGVEAVRSDRLVRENVRVEGNHLVIAGQALDLAAIGRIAVVGAGKAGAGMAAGLEQALGPRVLQDKQVTGWLNVPADCVRALAAIHLHAGRPAGVNEPTAEGLEGATQMMNLAASLNKDDLLIALVSGGGSALLPLPVEGITLDDKLAVTRFLSAAGAPIDELNVVRKQLSRIKGGGLARACRAGRLIALVISDILGDPLDLIASGPTVASDTSPARALDVLARYGAREAGIAERVFAALARQESAAPIRAAVNNIVIANNATAVNAAAAEARKLGHTVASNSAGAPEGVADEVGRDLAEQALAMRRGNGADCVVSGGEPTVKLVPPERRGLGGRNQQLVLAAVVRLQADGARGITILSGGTDGEDGPTDAAGAWANEQVIREAAQRGLVPSEYLARNDAYHWFEPLGALLKTGPTDTNVCDVRVVVVERDAPGKSRVAPAP